MIALTIVITYFSGSILTLLMWLWMLKRVSPTTQDFRVITRDSRYTTLILGLFWFVILPFVWIYWIIKRIGYEIYLFSNGRLCQRCGKPKINY